MQNRNRGIIFRAILQLFLFPENTVTQHANNKLDFASHCRNDLPVSLVAIPAIFLPWMRRYHPSIADALISLGGDFTGSSPLCPQGRT